MFRAGEGILWHVTNIIDRLHVLYTEFSHRFDGSSKARWAFERVKGRARDLHEEKLTKAEMLFIVSVFRALVLECRAFLEFWTLYEEDGTSPAEANEDLQGGFTLNPARIKALRRVGCPVWLVQPSIKLSYLMKIAEVSPVDYATDRIQFAEASPQFPVRFTGPTTSKAMALERSAVALSWFVFVDKG
jgi:hypothetical protein